MKSRPSGAASAGASASPRPEAIDDLEQAVDRLYSVDPDSFVAERDALTRELRDAGRREEATTVKALRKPSLSAWVVNRLARDERREIDLLLDASHRLREAQQGLLAGADQQSFEEARRTQRDALAALRKAASGILDEAGRGSETTLNRVAATLQAAAVSDDGRELLARGRLTGDVEASGFELLRPAAGKRPAPKGRRAAKQAPAKEAPAKDRRESRARLEEAREHLRDARAAAKDASAQVRTAEREARKAERELTDAQDRLQKAEATAYRAQQAVEDAEQQVREAERQR